MRIVDPPVTRSETKGDEPKRCTWTIYKSVEAIPESAYRRIGLEKPSSAGIASIDQSMRKPPLMSVTSPVI